MLVICGTQRTGSSMLSKFLKEQGYDFGTEFWHSEINGGLESPDICKSYQQHLNDTTFPFIDFNASIGDRQFTPLSDLEFEVQKFSFLLMRPEFVTHWYTQRGNRDKLLILSRNMEEVVESKRKTSERQQRFSGDHKLLQQTPNELKQNFYDSLQRVLEYGIDYILLRFPDFLKDYDKLYEVLTWGNLNVPHNSKAWESHVDYTKITCSPKSQK